jgi:integrase
MLTIRKRGAVFHIRGTVRVGNETRVIKEHSTGCNRRDQAEAYKTRLEAEIRGEILHGPGGRAQRMTIADAGLRWIARPGGVATYDVWRLEQINDLVGDYPIARTVEAWKEFRRGRCEGLQAATVERFRSVFQSALNFFAKEEGFDAPKIPRLDKVKTKPPRYLPESQATALIEAYVEHVRPIALTFAYQGLRSGEAMRLDWMYVRWQNNSLYIPETKTGVARTVSMHPKVRRALHRLWVKAGSPEQGTVFLNRLGEPYSDPRQYELPGGSPIRNAHTTACRRAGVKNFTVHDWRHHWACQCVMSGIDLETIRQEGGWKDLRMVQRYATVSSAHRQEQMKKLK